MNNISKNVLDKIKKEHIKPIPHWQFVLLHIVVWIGLVASIVLGSFAVGIVLREIFGTDWENVHRIGHDGIPGLVMVLPYVWFIALGLTLFLSSILAKHIKKSYKFSPLIITSGSILVSIILGSILYATNISDNFEQAVRDNFAPYRSLQETKEGMWMAPENGVVIGRIVATEGDTMLIINDITGQRWRIDIEDAEKPARFEPTVGNGVMAIGELIENKLFKADEIRMRDPNRMPGGMKMMQNHVPGIKPLPVKLPPLEL
jgi:signal peptidase I